MVRIGRLRVKVPVGEMKKNQPRLFINFSKTKGGGGFSSRHVIYGKYIENP